MATQKERPHSWKARGLVKRDFQHDHSGPEEMPHRKKGGNNKWCGKKEGRVCEYTEKVMKFSSAKYRSWVMACPICHKQKWNSYMTERLVTQTYIIDGEEHSREYWSGSRW